MTIQDACNALNDTTFLLGAVKRASALKELAKAADPAAAEILVSVVDANKPSAAKAREVLDADRQSGWGDKLWEIWAKNRQPWLLKTLLKRGATFSRRDCEVGILSRLVLGGQWTADAGTAERVSAFLNDADEKVQGVARQVFEGLQKSAPKVWVTALLRARLATLIGSDRKNVELLSPFLNSADPVLSSSAWECVSKWPVPGRVLAALLAGRDSELPLDREIAFAVADLRNDPTESVSTGAHDYLERALASEVDFGVALAFKSGYAAKAKVAVSATTVAEALRLLRDEDAEVSAAACTWLSVLPRDLRYHDALVEDWLHTDDARLGKLLRDGQRLPSNPGRQVMLRLLWGDAKGYLGMDDSDGAFLAEALAAASETHRARIVKTIEKSRDDEMADRFSRASFKAQGKDKPAAPSFFVCDRK